MEMRVCSLFSGIGGIDLAFQQAGFEIAEKLNAEFVCATGRKLVFYRRSKNPKVEHIIF